MIYGKTRFPAMNRQGYTAATQWPHDQAALLRVQTDVWNFYWLLNKVSKWNLKKKKSHFRAEIITTLLWELVINKSKATEGTKHIILQPNT